MHFTVESESYNIDKTIESGQLFRFIRNEDGSYTVFSGGGYCNIRRNCNLIEVWNDISDEDGREQLKWNYFFGFDDDMWSLEKLMLQSSFLADIYEECKGLHLLNQNPWETLICFIISQQKRISQIKVCVESVCEAAGRYNSRFDFYSFPTPEEIFYSDLSLCGLGYREEYIKLAAKRVLAGNFDLESLFAYHCTYDDAKNKLMELYGVGSKVADCVCLFGLGYRRAFPIDVHIERVLRLPEMSNFSIETCGDYAGYVQQYLFKYAIDHNI